LLLSFGIKCSLIAVNDDTEDNPKWCGNNGDEVGDPDRWGSDFVGRMAADKTFDKCALFNTFRLEGAWADMSCRLLLELCIVQIRFAKLPRALCML